MKERIARLRGEIERLRDLANISDTRTAADLWALARDMEQTVSEMERKLFVGEADGATVHMDKGMPRMDGAT